jgi:hypothetical protein
MGALGNQKSTEVSQSPLGLHPLDLVLLTAHAELCLLFYQSWATVIHVAVIPVTILKRMLLFLAQF